MDRLDLLTSNHDLFKEIQILALDQERLILDNKIDDFMNLAAKREKIKDEISSNFKRYGKMVKKNKKKETKSSERALSMEISEVIRSIQDTDKKIEELIKQEKIKLFDEIKNAKIGKGALKGYGEKRQKTPRFIDRRG